MPANSRAGVLTTEGYIMPADALVLLSPDIIPEFQTLAEKKGKRIGGWARYLDLSETVFELPVRLFCRGIHDGTNKLQFVDVAELGLTRTREIAKTICKRLNSVTISRIDWCVDLWKISPIDLALYCRLGRARNCAFEKSHKGITFYPRRSRARSDLIYDRLARLRAIGDPLADYYTLGDKMTRVEVQMKGKGIPFRSFSEIEQYADLDMLPSLSFWNAGRKQDGLTSMNALAAEGLLRRIEEYGLQQVSKMYSSQTWGYLQKRLLVPASESEFPDVNRLLKQSTRDWLEDRFRFPRLRKPDES
jgi:hypothetical protein